MEGECGRGSELTGKREEGEADVLVEDTDQHVNWRASVMTVTRSLVTVETCWTC